ncbi:hypothetical protein DWX43_17120 [Clostridium sp. AF19-22AC]|jgi:heme/copper-type cytochrome/quinol oxidase subunit 2|uniref:hypothetical protein n=1 Tax=Clostridia TaxID=186801 RepID=UPI000E515114|nr:MULTISPECIES: hypothetical protein [Clostridia]RHR25845.1 hypothetical protein DWX43_17120 [Clostridium sp. AF19-22AC]
MKEIIFNMKKAWKESKKQKAIIVTLIFFLIFGCVWVLYSMYFYYMEFKSYENWLRICFAMLVLYSFPIMYSILDKLAQKNRELKRILAIKSKEDKEKALEDYEFITFFQCMAEILTRLSTIVLIVFINELLTQIPLISEDIKYIANREAYWGLLQIMIYIILIFSVLVILYSESFLFCRGCRKRKIRKLLKRSNSDKKDVEHVLED